MADLFEQIVADFLTGRGYLTKLNVNYRKPDGRQSGSDIDVLAVHGINHTVIVGDCKSWQGGFAGDWMLNPSLTSAKRQRERFKPIFEPEWAEGLANQVEKEFGVRKFTYTIYCTRLDGTFEKLIKRTVTGNRIEVVVLDDIIRETVQRVNKKTDQSIEPTTLGRLVQLLLSAGINLPTAK